MLRTIAMYTVDNVGNRTGKFNHLTGVPEAYDYDQIYQLTEVVQDLNGTPTLTEDYTYDAVGNRLSSLGLSPYSYNSSNHLTSTPAATFTYDNNGNTTSKVDANGTTSYSWSMADQLTSVTLPNNGGTVSFNYDVFGRRVRKVAPAGTTIYLYDGANIRGGVFFGLQARPCAPCKKSPTASEVLGGRSAGN